MEGIAVDDQAEAQPNNFIKITADLVAAYVSNNRASLTELLGVIASVHAALSSLGKEELAQPVVKKPTPTQIKKSITPDGMVSFEDGKTYKTMKRHLTLHGLTPDGYRAKYGLPSDYPIVSAAYSAKRSELARSLSLGQLRRNAALRAAAISDTNSEVFKNRGVKPRAVKELVDAPEATPKVRGRKKVAERA